MAGKFLYLANIIEGMKAGIVGAVESGSTDLSAVETALTTIKTDVAASKSSLSTISTNAAAIKTSAAAIKTNTDTIKTDVSAIKTSVNSINVGVGNKIEKTYIFRKSVAAGASGNVDVSVAAAGRLSAVNVIFAAGENGTLQLTPVKLTGSTETPVFAYADLAYISGDDCVYKLACDIPVTATDKLRIKYKNTGAAGTANSEIMVDMVVIEGV